MSSVGSEAGSEEGMASRCGDIVRTGYMKKLKTMKKKFFVLRSDSSNFPACLEYYDSGKKWKNKHPPKRSVVLKNCFSVSRRTDTKHKYVIALYTGVECFGIVLESEEDLQEWLRLLLMYQYGEDISDGYLLKPYYEHVWKVTVQKKELACKHNLSGVYLLCLTECTLLLARPAVEEDQETKAYEFALQCIRRCGNLDTVFYIELGQASCIGAGNLWMQTEDSNIAQHMHSVIMKGCTSCPKKEFAPKSRSRSSSANEASKPMYFGRKWPSSGDDSLSGLSCTKSLSHQEHSIMSPNSGGHSVSSTGDGVHHHPYHHPYLHHHHLHHNPSLTSVSLSPYPPTRRASTGTRPVTTGPALLSSSRTNTSHIGRERCDSLPTRPRMTLDTLSSGGKTGNVVVYAGSVSGRPCSMYNRYVFSPPGLSHPTSPTSVTYSTDSAGSSLSVDVDNENWPEIDSMHRTILEERGEEYVQWGGVQSRNFSCENIPPSSRAAAVSRNNKFSVGQNNSSSNSQSSCSPCSSSPIDAGTYLPMSPIEPAVVDSRAARQPLNRSYDSMSHSRESSIHEDLGEGYVSMAPLSADAGYMSMDQSVHKRGGGGDSSPGLSSCSITSGTPSLDHRLSEFHLDKVSSYLTPSDDDIVFNVRQTRAYSTGSKPDAPHNKFIRCDSSDGLRTRAFSVGSKCSSNYLSTPRRTPNSTSASSIEPCDDLVEIDFTANKLRRRNLHQQRLKLQQQQSVVAAAAADMIDGYMDMSKSSPKSETSFNDLRSAATPDGGATNVASPPRLGRHLVGRSQSSVSANFSKQMMYTKSSPVIAAGGGLAKVMESSDSQCSTTQNAAAEDSQYMEMKPGVCDMPTPSPKAVSIIATASNLHARKENFAPPPMALCPPTLPHIKQPLLETDGKQFRQQTPTTPPEGYVDMSFKGRRASTESYQPAKAAAAAAAAAKLVPESTPEGYVDMSFKKNLRKNLVDSNCFAHVKKPVETTTKHSFFWSGKENHLAAETRQCSKPIAIQQGKSRRSQAANFFRRHKSEETPQHTASKPSFLPLGLNIPGTFAIGRKKKGCSKKEKTECTTVFPLSPEREHLFPFERLQEYMELHSYRPFHCRVPPEELAKYDLSEVIKKYPKLEEVAQLPGSPMMLSPSPPPPIRKTSEPRCMKYSGRSDSIAKEAKDSINRNLQRSTSVPSTFCGTRGWRPKSVEWNEAMNYLKSRSDSAMECAQLSVTPPSSYSNETVDNVPHVYTSIYNPYSTICTREEVTYVTLDMPPSEQEPSIKSEEFASSTSQSDESNLTYAEIDFNKPSRSSSPSK